MAGRITNTHTTVSVPRHYEECDQTKKINEQKNAPAANSTYCPCSRGKATSRGEEALDDCRAGSHVGPGADAGGAAANKPSGAALCRCLSSSAVGTISANNWSRDSLQRPTANNGRPARPRRRPGPTRASTSGRRTQARTRERAPFERDNPVGPVTGDEG